MGRKREMKVEATFERNYVRPDKGLICFPFASRAREKINSIGKFMNDEALRVVYKLIPISQTVFLIALASSVLLRSRHSYRERKNQPADERQTCRAKTYFVH